jgi:hypothetical protein
MLACALLLVGIVALQVAVLRQNIERGQLDRTRQDVAAGNQNLQAQLEQATSQPVVAARARDLGMYQPGADTVKSLAGG